MKITIIGAYGCGNIGDDAILEGLLRKIKQQYGSNHEICVLALDTDYIESIFPVRAIRQIVARGLTWNVVKGFAFADILKALRNSDILIIGGGSLIHDRRFYNMPYYVLLAGWARIFGAKVFLRGVSIGPLSTKVGRWLMRCLHTMCSEVTYRDERSLSWLRQAGFSEHQPISCDLAFMIPPENEVKESRDYIALNICGWFRSEDYWNKEESLLEQEINNFATLADRIIEEFDQDIVFLNTVVPFDSDTAYRIAKEMVYTDRVKVMDRLMTPTQIKELLRGASLLIGMRLHSIIFSTLTVTPFVAINYDDKVKSFVKRIAQDEYLLELDDLNHIDTVIETCRKCWNSREQVTQSIKLSANYMHQLINNEVWMKVS